MFNLSPIYSAQKSSNHKLFKNHKISPVLDRIKQFVLIYIKQNIHKYRTQNFQRISPLGITPVKKVHKARTHWYRGPFRRFINTRFLKNIKKDWTEAIKKLQILYKCITANTSAIWQHAARTTNQLTSPSC